MRPWRTCSIGLVGNGVSYLYNNSVDPLLRLHSAPVLYWEWFLHNSRGHWLIKDPHTHLPLPNRLPLFHPTMAAVYRSFSLVNGKGRRAWGLARDVEGRERKGRDGKASTPLLAWPWSPSRRDGGNKFQNLSELFCSHVKLGEKLVKETLRGSVCLGLRQLRGRGTPFSRPLHREASQGLDPLGALRVNNSGMDSVLMMDSGPGKTSALAKPQQ